MLHSLLSNSVGWSMSRGFCRLERKREITALLSGFSKEGTQVMKVLYVIHVPRARMFSERIHALFEYAP